MLSNTDYTHGTRQDVKSPHRSSFFSLLGPPPKRRKWLCCILTCFVISSLLGFAIRYCSFKSTIFQTSKCPVTNWPTFSTKSQDKFIFELLSADEMKTVWDFMRKHRLITTPQNTVPLLTDDYIYGMSLHMPNKDKALYHLDAGGAYIGRYAEVHVHRGSRDPPDIMEYKIGPLGGTLVSKPLHKNGDLPFNSRPRDKTEDASVTELVSQAMTILRPLLQKSFDGAYYPGGGLQFQAEAPNGLKAEERETRIVMTFHVEGTSKGGDLHHLPLSATVHNPGTNTRKWYMHSFCYLNQGPFPSAKSLLTAYTTGTLRNVSMPHGYRKKLVSITLPKQKSGFRRSFSERTPPRSYCPSGQRFSIHDHTVTWMGWELTIVASQFRGPGLFNVKFKEERILYENSLNDIVLVYSSDSSEGNNIYMDTTLGLGEYQDLIKGVDCPHHAILLDAVWFDSYKQSPVTAKSICVFESAGEEALWLRKDSFAAGLANNYLTIRIPLTVGNYDYTIDFKFYLDGSLKTEASTSGYIQASFWDAENPHVGKEKEFDAFGSRVGPFAHGAMHDHTFSFKVDLDVLGPANSFQMIHWKGGSVSEALQTQAKIQSKPSYYLHNYTRYIEREILEKESGFRIDMNHPKYWTVINEKKNNKWGVKRGYKIHTDTSASQVLPEGHPIMKAAAFTKYHCMVTKYRDSEQHLTGIYDLNRLADPLVSMDNYLNNEPIRNIDLVTWLSFGFLHVPTSEDIPMTIAPRSGFTLKPFNYFDTTASFDMPQYFDTSDHSVTERPPPLEPCEEITVDNGYFN